MAEPAAATVAVDRRYISCSGLVHRLSWAVILVWVGL